MYTHSVHVLKIQFGTLDKIWCKRLKGWVDIDINQLESIGSISMAVSVTAPYMNQLHGILWVAERYSHHGVAVTWWRHQMETFSALLAICAGNSPVPGEFPTQRLVTRSFDVYFDLRPNKWMSKQSWGWWFETLSCSLWRQRNDQSKYDMKFKAL